MVSYIFHTNMHTFVKVCKMAKSSSGSEGLTICVTQMAVKGLKVDFAEKKLQPYLLYEELRT